MVLKLQVLIWIKNKYQIYKDIKINRIFLRNVLISHHLIHHRINRIIIIIIIIMKIKIINQ